MDQTPEYELPENPEETFYHGQYQKLDDYVCIKILKLDEFSLIGKRVKLLDVDSGVNSNGSPVSQDFCERLKETGAEPEVTALGKDYQERVAYDSECKYVDDLKSLDQNAHFDIIRLFYFGKDLEPSRYDEIMSNREELDKRREQIVNRLKEGGLLIALQDMKGLGTSRDSFGDRREIEYQPFIKIMQKREGMLVPIGLFPSSYLPLKHESGDLIRDDFFAWEQYEEAYLKFREKVNNRQERIPAGSLDREGYKDTVKDLRHAEPKIFDAERDFALTGTPDGYHLDNQGKVIFEEMGKNRPSAPQAFRECIETQ